MSREMNAKANPKATPDPFLARRRKLYTNVEFPLCPDVDEKYSKISQIGQGTFGVVYKAKNKVTQELVALKKIITDNETQGFPITALREIKLLKILDHENIVKIIEVSRTKASETSQFKSSFYIVFEFCDHDLAGLLANKLIQFHLGDIKAILRQLLDGLYFIHYHKILHRDVKPANILIHKSGTVKLADFGLAKQINSVEEATRPLTNPVVTMWYRAPEILLGKQNYGSPIDMWSAGCVMAEMFTKAPIMTGVSEVAQLKLIIALCGSITEETWPGVEKLQKFSSVAVSATPRSVKTRMSSYVTDTGSLDLLDKLFILDPKQRIDADKALNHDVFYTDPMPSNLGETMSKISQSNFEYLSRPNQSAGMQQPFRVPHNPARNLPMIPPRPPAASNFNSMFDRTY